VRALGVLGYQVLMPGHSTTDVERSFLRHSNIRCRCLSRVDGVEKVSDERGVALYLNF
jgi:hypothetical protein